MSARHFQGLLVSREQSTTPNAWCDFSLRRTSQAVCDRCSVNIPFTPVCVVAHHVAFYRDFTSVAERYVIGHGLFHSANLSVSSNYRPSINKRAARSKCIGNSAFLQEKFSLRVISRRTDLYTHERNPALWQFQTLSYISALDQVSLDISIFK